MYCVVSGSACSFSQEGNEWDALGRQGLSNVLRKTPPLLPIVELSVSVELRCDLIVWDMVPHSFSPTGCVAVAAFPRVTLRNCLLHFCTQNEVFLGTVLIIDIRGRDHLTSIDNDSTLLVQDTDVYICKVISLIK